MFVILEPPALSAVEVTERTQASLTLQFAIPEAYNYEKIEVVYQIEDGSMPVQNQPNIKINQQNKTGTVRDRLLYHRRFQNKEKLAFGLALS